MVLVQCDLLFRRTVDPHLGHLFGFTPIFLEDVTSGFVGVYNALLQHLFAQQVPQRYKPPGTSDDPVGHGAAPQLHTLAFPILLLPVERNAFLEFFLHDICHGGRSRHALFHDRNRSLGLQNVALSRFLFAMDTLIACRIVVHYRHLSRNNNEFGTQVFLPDPHHLIAASGAELLVFRKLAEHLLVLQSLGQLGFGTFFFTGVRLDRCRFSRFRCAGVAASLCLIEEIQLLSVYILDLLAGPPKCPPAQIHQLLIQRLHFQQLVLLLLVLFPQCCNLCFQRLYFFYSGLKGADVGGNFR